MSVTRIVHPYFYCSSLCPLPLALHRSCGRAVGRQKRRRDFVHDLVSPQLQRAQHCECHTCALTTAWRKVPSPPRTAGSCRPCPKPGVFVSERCWNAAPGHAEQSGTPEVISVLLTSTGILHQRVANWDPRCTSGRRFNNFTREDHTRISNRQPRNSAEKKRNLDSQPASHA